MRRGTVLFIRDWERAGLIVRKIDCEVNRSLGWKELDMILQWGNKIPWFLDQPPRWQSFPGDQSTRHLCKTLAFLAKVAKAACLNLLNPRVLLWGICQQQGLQGIIYFAFVCEQVPVSCERAKLGEKSFPRRFTFLCGRVWTLVLKVSIILFKTIAARSLAGVSALTTLSAMSTECTKCINIKLTCLPPSPSHSFSSN